MNQHLFISYSRKDGTVLARQLSDGLRRGSPPFEVWLDTTGIRPGTKWAFELDEAIKNCRCLVYLMTPDSVSLDSSCPEEIARANRYKKSIVPVIAGKDVVPPFGLESVQHIDITDNFASGLSLLRETLLWTETPEGELSSAKYHRARLIRRRNDASPSERVRIDEELARLDQRVSDLEQWVADPEKAKKKKDTHISDGIETVRHESDRVPSRISSKFVNSAAFVPPLHFQDRHTETKLAVEFLKNPDKRLLTIVGRGGVGKTGMVSRLLKGIETGKLPDDLGELPVVGLVYLSEQRARRVSFPHLFEDLTKLLDATSAEKAEAVYRSPQTPTPAKMNALLSLLPKGLIVVLLDNFEELVGEGRATKDRELFDALISWLHAPPNDLKIIITTRISPADLSLAVPAACDEIPLDEGLASPHAENLLKQLDNDGAAGFRSAPPEMLSEVAQRVRGYPRALEALYAVLRNDRNTSLDELLGKATETLPEKVVEVMVGEAFSRLDRHEKLILQALAIFNRPVPAVALDYLLQPFVPAIESVSVLRWLVNLQIVRKDRDRYYLHPVDSEFALAQVLDEASLPTGSLGTTAMTRKALFGRAAEYFREIRKPKTEWDSIQDLEPQLAEFDLLCRSEQYDEAAALLLAIGFNYLRSWGHVGMLLELHEQLRGHVTDQRTEVHCLGVLGTVYWDTGNLSQAVTDLRNCIELTAQTSGANAGAAWWCDLGCCLRDMGRIDEALVAHEKALQIDHYTGDGSGMEIDIQNSAECYADKGLIALAIRAVRLSLEAIPIVDPHDVPHAMAFRLATLAACLIDAQEWHTASAKAAEALSFAQELHYGLAIARAGHYLALSKLNEGEYDNAGEAATLSLKCEYARFKFRTLLVRGIIALKLNRSREAQDDFSLCQKECEGLVARCRDHYLAYIHLALANCGLFACGQAAALKQAKDILNQCAALKEYSGIRGRCLHLLRLIASHDPSRQLSRLALVIEGAAIGQPKPVPPDHSVLEHEAVRKLRATLIPTRLSKLHSQGFFEQCAEIATEGESVINMMSPHQRREFLRVRAWVQARRGFLDGPSILDSIQDEGYMGYLLWVSDYMAVYRFQGLIPAVELRGWVDRGRQILNENSEDDSGAQVLLNEYSGCALLAEGHYEAAEQSLQKALVAENADKKDVRILARLQAALGETYRLLGDLEKAEHFLETAAAFQEEHGFNGDLCEYTLPHLAKLHVGQPSAMEYLQQARASAERLRHRKALLRALLIEARISEEVGRQSEIFSKAEELAKNLSAVSVCPLWTRIHSSWSAWRGEMGGQTSDFWGL